MDSSYIEYAISSFGDTVLRVAFSVTCNKADAEDVFSDVFFALYKRIEPFESGDHLKAWLIKSAANRAKNIRSSAWHKRRQALDESIAAQHTETHEEVLDALKKLKQKERAVVYLHYYEGYAFKEIALLLALNQSTAKSIAKRAKAKLKALLEEDYR